MLGESLKLSRATKTAILRSHLVYEKPENRYSRSSIFKMCADFTLWKTDEKATHEFKDITDCSCDINSNIVDFSYSP